MVQQHIILRYQVASMSISSVESSSSQSRFVKVYKEGNLIGRKLNLFAFNNYESLVVALSVMFDTIIICK